MPLLSLRAFYFDQTYLANARQISRLIRIVRQRSMTMPKNDKYKDYARYAERCLNMVAATTDRESRSIQREMAAEWLRLADAIRRPRRSSKCKWDDAFKSNPEVKEAHREIQKRPSAWKRAGTRSW